MADISDFSLKDMVEFSAALRSTGSGADNMEEAADRIVHYLYDHLVDARTGERTCALVRFFKTHSYEDLGPDLQEFALRRVPAAHESPAMKCLVLLASSGIRPDWNIPQKSVDHWAIPLPSERFIETFPMVSQLIRQMGLELKTVIQPDPDIIMDMAQTTYNVFYLPEALGNKYVPAQEDFVIPFGIRSVLGFGGVLPSGNFFAIIIFSKVPVPPQTADIFRTLALSVKVAVLPFVGKSTLT